MNGSLSRRGLALYLALVSIVTGGLLVLSALQLADSRTRGARRWSEAMEVVVRLHNHDLSGVSDDTMAIGAGTQTTDSGAGWWVRDRVQRLDDTLFSRRIEVGGSGQAGDRIRWSGRLATWCRGPDSLSIPRPLCPLGVGRIGPP